MKILKKVGLALLVLIVIIGISAFFYLQSIKPTYSGEIELEGLKNYTEHILMTTEFRIFMLKILKI